MVLVVQEIFQSNSKLVVAVEFRSHSRDIRENVNGPAAAKYVRLQLIVYCKRITGEEIDADHGGYFRMEYQADGQFEKGGMEALVPTGPYLVDDDQIVTRNKIYGLDALCCLPPARIALPVTA